MSYWQDNPPKESKDLGNGVAYTFHCDDSAGHEHTKNCIWIWHNCQLILGPETVAPGQKFGWRPSGIMGHELVSVEPLTVSPSVYWPGCCDKHGFITDGQYADV